MIWWLGLLDAPFQKFGSIDIPTPFNENLEQKIFWPKSELKKQITNPSIKLKIKSNINLKRVPLSVLSNRDFTFFSKEFNNIFFEFKIELLFLEV